MAVHASSEQQRALLDLQGLDTQVFQIDHKVASLPERAKVNELEVALGSLDYRIVGVKTEVADLSLEVSKAESDVEQVRNRAARDQERLDSGAVNAVKELESLQHEIASLAKRQVELEDVEIEIMQRAEEAQGAMNQMLSERDSLAVELEAARVTLQQVESELAAAREQAMNDRVIIAEKIPADLMALYEKIRADLGGVGAALLQRGTCQGCRLAVDATELDRIRSASQDEVVRCEECRRILIRTSESGL
ncbi:MAG: hypothetical protein F2839_00765 [Actinobacteria bacterium]|uniref:Unannotated protein n=1 Tax=freshwater metagenome TaxID=449393 RepID=A0A6J5YPG2_9ZZZZ|nr:hypothetical protein [Actinomycetota bacterium]